MRNPFHSEDEAREIAEVNVVPLADVSLVLLIILLLLSPMMAQSSLHVRTSAKMEAPEEPIETMLPPELVLMVDVGPGGIAVGDHLFAGVGELQEYLRGELYNRRDRKVFLAPHPDVTHGRVVELLDAIKESGADTVALVQTL